MKIGFAELGRIMKYKDSVGPFPYDALRLLERLARRHRDIEWVVFGPCSETPTDAPNVTSPWGEKRLSHEQIVERAAGALAGCDAAVVFVNQHMSVSVDNCPKLREPGFVVPLQQARRSCGPTVAALNAWQDADSTRDPVYVVNDPRTYMNLRDLKWAPRRPIVAQYNDAVWRKHYRYGDTRSPEELGYDPQDVVVNDPEGHWTVRHRYTHSDVQLMALTPNGMAEHDR